MAGVETARKAGVKDSIKIRCCVSLEELRACVTLQQEVWGFSDADLVPLRMFVVALHIGGQVLGAFEGNQLVGYLLGLPGARNGQPYLHSHMLAVRNDHRNQGLGRRIKLFQREDALARGFELIEWTFDPLEIKNAYLNLCRLGAIARRYNVNQYGSSSSPLQGGLPTDRLVAEWWLRSRRVETLLKTDSLPNYPVSERVKVPAEVYAWKSSQEDRGRAAEVQSRNRQQLIQAFGNGLAAIGYEHDAQGNGSFLLGAWDEICDSAPRWSSK